LESGEKQHASCSRSVLWLLGLLGILASLFVIVRLMSRLHHQTNPANGPQPHPGNQSRDIETVTANTPPNPIPSNNAESESHSRKPYVWEKISSVAQLIIALVTLGLLIVNFQQLGAIREQSRPQIVFTAFELIWSDERLFESCRIKNTGQTAAYHVRIEPYTMPNIQFWQADTGLYYMWPRLPEKEPNPDPKGFILRPGDDTEECILQDRNVEMTRIVGNPMIYYVSWEDAFGSKWIMHRCLLYQPDKGRPLPCLFWQEHTMPNR
jgi:hypothetical protein